MDDLVEWPLQPQPQRDDCMWTLEESGVVHLTTHRLIRRSKKGHGLVVDLSELLPLALPLRAVTMGVKMSGEALIFTLVGSFSSETWELPIRIAMRSSFWRSCTPFYARSR